MGFYFGQLVRYLSLFSKEQLLVRLHEDLNSAPRKTLREVFSFLGVDAHFESNTSDRRNVSLVPEHVTYHRLVAGQSPLKSLGRAVLPVQTRQRIKSLLPASRMRKPEPIPQEARAMLIEVFREDTLRLQGLLNRDLGNWLR
jgi:hypothetical protein